MHKALKRRAKDTVENPTAVISEVLTNESQAALGSLPDASAIKKTIKRTSKAISAPFPNSVDLQELEFSYQY